MSPANPRQHAIPDEIFAALAGGGGGSAAVAHLVNVEHSRHVLLVRGVVDAARQSAHREYGKTRAAYEVLAAVQERAPAVVDAVLRYPSVGSWARRTVLALRSGITLPGAEPAGLAAVSAAAAIRSGFSCEIEVPVVGGVITLPSLGQVTRLAADCRAATVRSGAGGADVMAGGRRVPIPGDPNGDGPGWLGMRRLAAQSGGQVIRLLVDDLDPFRVPHPSRGPRLTAAEAGRWQEALQGAWELLVTWHRVTAAEVLAAITVLTPLAATASGQASATSRETFGSVALSPPRDPLSLALTLAHEVQHAKLCALLDVVKLTNSDGRLFYAPWRDDPRPVSSLLQGAYAYLGVTRFWRSQRQVEEGGYRAVRAHAEFAKWRSAVADATRVLLDSGSLTRRGEAFVAGMATVIRGWGDETVPATALAVAQREAAWHAARWRERYGPPDARSGAARKG